MKGFCPKFRHHRGRHAGKKKPVVQEVLAACPNHVARADAVQGILVTGRRQRAWSPSARCSAWRALENKAACRAGHDRPRAEGRRRVAHVRIAETRENIPPVRIAAGGASLMLVLRHDRLQRRTKRIAKMQGG